MKRIAILILVSIIFFSCQNKEHRRSNESLNDSAKVTFEEFISSEYNGIVDKRKIFLNNDSLLLFTLDGLQQKFEILNITSKSVKNILQLNALDDYNKYGLNIDDFYIHNMDSIFLYSHYTRHVALIDSAGSFKKVINLSQAINSFQSDNFLEIDLSGNFSYNSVKNELVFKTHSPYNFDKDKNYFDKSIITTYDINTETFINTLGNYPETDIYHNSDNFFVNTYELSYIPFYDSNKYYVSFIADHNIYEFSINDNTLLNVYNGKSNFLKEDFNLIPRSSDRQNIINHMIENGKYKKLLYNQYKKQFYRIVTHNQSLKNENTGKLNNMTFNRDFSIIVFNEDMSIKGEYLFENPQYTFFDITTHPKGILINYKDKNDENKNILEILDL